MARIDVSAPPVPRIGARLKAIRLARGTTLEQLAEITGLNKGSISRIENDAMSPSAATLWSLCSVLDITVGSLFEVADSDFVRRGEYAISPTNVVGVVEHLLTPRRQAQLQLVHAVIAPGGSAGEGLYTINCDVQVGYVLAGELEIRFASGVRALVAGDALTFTGREPHSYMNPSLCHDAEVIWVLVPAIWAAGPVKEIHPPDA
ncbi:helix-turn-helix domain-containing protein [Rhodococcus sp. NPDC055024]